MPVQFPRDSKGLFGILIWKSCAPLVINVWTKRILPMSQKIYVVLNNLHKNGLVLDRNFERPKQLEPQVCTRTRSRPVVEVGLFLMGSLSFSKEFLYFLYSKLKRYTFITWISKIILCTIICKAIHILWNYKIQSWMLLTFLMLMNILGHVKLKRWLKLKIGITTKDTWLDFFWNIIYVGKLIFTLLFL